VVVAEQLTEINALMERGPVKSRAGARTVVLPKAAADALALHLDTWADIEPDGLVFTAPEGGPLRHSNCTHRVWYPATKAAGVEGLRFHDLRHTAATLALAAGANTRELKQHIGHPSPTAALRYQHVMDGQDAPAASALDDMIAAADERSGTRMARRPRKRQRPVGE
jgi:integrase